MKSPENMKVSSRSIITLLHSPPQVLKEKRQNNNNKKDNKKDKKRRQKKDDTKRWAECYKKKNRKRGPQETTIRIKRKNRNP